MANFEDLQKRAHQISRSKGWWDNDDRSFGDFCALFHSEISEAFEAYRDRGYDYCIGDDGKPEGVYDELADTIIRIMDFCESQGVFLADIIQNKMNYNETRPHRHGGKAL